MMTATITKKTVRAPDTDTSDLMPSGQFAPTRIGLGFLAFSESISPERYVIVPRAPQSSDCPCPFRAVSQMVVQCNGLPLHGWVLGLHANAWASATFRPMWMSNEKQILDLVDDGSFGRDTVFVPDARVDASKPPTMLFERLAVSEAEIAATEVFIGSLCQEDRTALEASVNRKGLTLAQAIRSNLSTGCPLSAEIDKYLEEIGALGAMTTKAGATVRESHRATEFELRSAAAERARRSLVRSLSRLPGMSRLSQMG